MTGDLQPGALRVDGQSMDSVDQSADTCQFGLTVLTKKEMTRGPTRVPTGPTGMRTAARGRDERVALRCRVVERGSLSCLNPVTNLVKGADSF